MTGSYLTTSSSLSSQGWARDWLQEVNEARIAVDREEAISRAMEDRAFRISRPSTTGRGNHGNSDGTDVIDAKVDRDSSDPVAWARVVLARFDATYSSMRPGLRGTIAGGLDACRLRYRLGMSEKQAISALGISKTTIHAWIDSLLDYFDYLGPSTISNDSRGDSNEYVSAP